MHYQAWWKAVVRGGEPTGSGWDGGTDRRAEHVGCAVGCHHADKVLRVGR
jgi:hypothetical protein